MPTGFIYVVQTVQSNYQQADSGCVPYANGNTLYFGPCKRSMRPKMQSGDYIFGVSPSHTRPRRILFAVRIKERMTFAEAYQRFPRLRGRGGQIHVRPTRSPGLDYPDSHYEHIPGGTHEGEWRKDISRPDQDAFFVCRAGFPSLGPWLGAGGPTVPGGILEFLRRCSVHGKAGKLARSNMGATERIPMRHGGLFTGLHLETDAPLTLLSLVTRSASLTGC